MRNHAARVLMVLALLAVARTGAAAPSDADYRRLNEALINGHVVPRYERLAEATKFQKQHGVAADQQGCDRYGNPWKEAAEDVAPECEPHRSLQRARGRPQHGISERHSADPEQGGENMRSQKQNQHGGVSLSSKGFGRIWCSGAEKSTNSPHDDDGPTQPVRSIAAR